MASPPQHPVAVYCASSLGKQEAFHNAAISVGSALANANRQLVYGGGSTGIMGIVSQAALANGGQVLGIIPHAMFAAGGEGSGSAETPSPSLPLSPTKLGNMETIIVNSMHERKVKMAELATAFIGLPGGFGTLEEILEVTTWNQIGIHDKPIILLNVLAFFNPLRDLIQNGVREGYIRQRIDTLIVFVDGPSDHRDHLNYDWGNAALQALTDWKPSANKPLYNWKRRMSGELAHSNLEAA